MRSNNLLENLKKLRIDHIFGMAGLMYIQPDISKLTEEDINNAVVFVDDLTTRINWGIELKQTDENKAVIEKVEDLSDEDAENYFKEVFEHFNVKE